MPGSLSKLFRATRLTRKGRFVAAALLVQQALGMGPAVRKVRSTAPKKAVRKVVKPAVPSRALLRPLRAKSTVSATQAPAPSPASALKSARPASFTSHAFTLAGERHAYRLFVPAVAAVDAATPLPLVVMLHGCKQDAADFARGTGMNTLAQQHLCQVLYPEQRTKSNGMRCWNWFEPANQLRGSGEPALLAALVQRVVAQHPTDTSRIYVAGLSAGAAMAALVSALYPELFAAAGLHSGLPAGAARNVVSAFRVMRSGAAAGAAPFGPAVPTVVFHGTADGTVHPENGDTLVAGALAAFKAEQRKLKAESRVVKDAGRTATRTVYRDESGQPQVEQWRVDGGPHAWSGGHAEGSFTDPEGPAASAAMLEFMLQHHK